ncbi:hypothetical protein AVEN_239354-1 [Araneus ventricosus]|uniref:Uncharacterized protein n=1 Tax=Araneus ventricosus TaxID=182803 RepID=A0A4Y2EEU4_ARAVE|nr:hypothetical protein AVEN_239354-1 [Araneus ventricosus]
MCHGPHGRSTPLRICQLEVNPNRCGENYQLREDHFPLQGSMKELEYVGRDSSSSSWVPLRRTPPVCLINHFAQVSFYLLFN